MVKLQGCKPVFDAVDFQQVKEQLPTVPRPKKRLMELLCKTALEPSTKEGTKSWNLKFLRSPLEILAQEGSSTVTGIRLAVNKLRENDSGSIVAESTGEVEDVPCGLVFRSIGYKSIAVGDDVPFDSKRGIVPNINGRVVELDEDKNHTSTVIPGLYCSGWVRQGPVGVIATTMNDAFSTGAVVVEDIKSGLAKTQSDAKGFVAIEKLLQERGVKPVFFKQWDKIDRVEQEQGAKKQKPREKIVSVRDMIDIAYSNER